MNLMKFILFTDIILLYEQLLIDMMVYYATKFDIFVTNFF